MQNKFRGSFTVNCGTLKIHKKPTFFLVKLFMLINVFNNLRSWYLTIKNYIFSQRSNLQSHKRSTHYDDKRYKCTDCGRAFKRRRLLDYHMKAAHTGERPYKCTICLATFIYPEHFKKHKLIHTGEKPYECEVC